MKLLTSSFHHNKNKAAQCNKLMLGLMLVLGMMLTVASLVQGVNPDPGTQPPPAPTVTVTVSGGPSGVMLPGETATLSVDVEVADGDFTDGNISGASSVQLSSSTLSDGGNSITITALSGGTDSLTATANAEETVCYQTGSDSASSSVTVEDYSEITVGISGVPSYLEVGKTADISVSSEVAVGIFRDGTITGDGFVSVSSGTLNDGDTSITITGSQVGTGTITAQSFAVGQQRTDNIGSDSTTATIQIVEAPTVTVSINNAPGEILVGQTLSASVTVSSSEDEDNITISSSSLAANNPNITISPSTLHLGNNPITITGVTVGSSIIQADATVSHNITSLTGNDNDSSPIDVIPIPSTIEVVLSNVPQALQVGDTADITANVTVVEGTFTTGEVTANNSAIEIVSGGTLTKTGSNTIKIRAIAIGDGQLEATARGVDNSGNAITPEGTASASIEVVNLKSTLSSNKTHVIKGTGDCSKATITVDGSSTQGIDDLNEVKVSVISVNNVNLLSSPSNLNSGGKTTFEIAGQSAGDVLGIIHLSYKDVTGIENSDTDTTQLVVEELNAKIEIDDILCLSMDGVDNAKELTITTTNQTDLSTLTFELSASPANSIYFDQALTLSNVKFNQVINVAGVVLGAYTITADLDKIEEVPDFITPTKNIEVKEYITTLTINNTEETTDDYAILNTNSAGVEEQIYPVNPLPLSVDFMPCDPSDDKSYMAKLSQISADGGEIEFSTAEFILPYTLTEPLTIEGKKSGTITITASIFELDDNQEQTGNAVDTETIDVYLYPVEVRSDQAVNDGSYDISKHDQSYYQVGGLDDLRNEDEVLENALVLNFNDCADDNSLTARATTEFKLKAGDDPNLQIDGLSWKVLKKPTSSPDLNPAGTALTQTMKGDLRGGLYRFQLDGTDIETQVWLPLAGPDITSSWQSEINYFKNVWGPAYRAKLEEDFGHLIPGVKEVRIGVQILSDMQNVGGVLDWNGTTQSASSPNGYFIRAQGQEHRYTIAGAVVDWRKRNNMMFALIGREMGLAEIVLYYGGDANVAGNGSPDTPATKESYEVGFDLFDGVSLQTAMQNRGRSMQEPNGFAAKEWPSWETASIDFVIAGQATLDELIGEEPTEEPGTPRD